MLEQARHSRLALASNCGASRFAFNWGLEQGQAAMALRELELCLYGDVRSELLGWSLPALSSGGRRPTKVRPVRP